MVNLTHLKRLKAQYCGTQGRYISRESECSSSVAFVNLRLTISGLKKRLFIIRSFNTMEIFGKTESLLEVTI